MSEEGGKLHDGQRALGKPVGEIGKRGDGKAGCGGGKAPLTGKTGGGGGGGGEKDMEWSEGCWAHDGLKRRGTI